MYVTREIEWEATQLLAEALDGFVTHPSNTLMVIVSPDYSASIGMHMAHHLSKDGEMLDIAFIEVPYPDQDVNIYIQKFLNSGSLANYKSYKQVILIEAGVISGKNYTWITNILNQHNIPFITSTLFEHTNSQYKSDAVGMYYNTDLEFYWERHNTHWV